MNTRILVIVVDTIVGSWDDADKCTCGSRNHPSVIPGEYVHSESCPLYDD